MAIEATKANIDPFHLPDSLVDADINKIDLISRYLDMNADPHTIFINAIKSPNTREKYDRRLKIFLDFIKIPGDDMKDRCILLSEKGKNKILKSILDELAEAKHLLPEEKKRLIEFRTKAEDF